MVKRQRTRNDKYFPYVPYSQLNSPYQLLFHSFLSSLRLFLVLVSCLLVKGDSPAYWPDNHFYSESICFHNRKMAMIIFVFVLMIIWSKRIISIIVKKRMIFWSFWLLDGQPWQFPSLFWLPYQQTKHYRVPYYCSCVVHFIKDIFHTAARAIWSKWTLS